MPSFIAALFDVSFDRFITPRLLTAIYIIEMIMSVAGWFAFGVKGFTGADGGFFHGIFYLFIIAPIGFVLTLMLIRVGLELLMAVFKIAEYAKHIADQAGR